MDRKEMVRTLDEWMGRSYAGFKDSGRLPSGRNPLKSYVVEANVEGVGEHAHALQQFFSGPDVPTPVEMSETDDPSLPLLQLGGKRVSFFLDTLDPRFWLLHSTATADAADNAIRGLVQRTRLLDSMWLPSQYLESWSGDLGEPRVLTGKFAVPTGLYRDELPEDEFVNDSLFLRIGASGDARVRWRQLREAKELAPSLALWAARIVRRDLSRDYVVLDDVTAIGKLTCRGNSFRLHQELLHALKTRYAGLIEEWERTYRIGWEASGSSAKPVGTTADLVLPRPLEEHELESLMSSLFSCGEPYRLYGVPIRQGYLRYVVRGVDLHTGHKIDFELGPSLLRAYLHQKTCGNVLARLLTNLQHYHDARVGLQ